MHDLVHRNVLGGLAFRLSRGAPGRAGRMLMLDR
jgi:hypothetical protein